MVGDGIRVEVEDFGNEAGPGTFVVHADDQKFKLCFFGSLKGEIGAIGQADDAHDVAVVIH